MDERAIFMEALEKNTPAERAAYLDDAVAHDAALRRRVEALLKSHLEASGFLEQTVPDRLVDKSVTSEGTVAKDGVRNLLGFLAPTDVPGSLGRLGHYEVLECLGQGAFGIVLRAFDDSLQRVVAVKVLAPEMAVTSPPRKRFLREARTAAKVRHENVIQIYAVEEQPTPYLVMEYIPGETLQERLDRIGPLEVPEVLRLGCQMARGLAAAHEQGLIHRDIKPGNILLEKGLEERVKISDFGLARAADDASLTQSGIIAGTPMFMAPEQAHGETIDQRADLFSLGSVLYTMVSGRPPFRASNTVAVLKRVCDDTPRPIQELIPETPQWLCDIIAKLQAKHADDRYQTAKEVADVLGERLAQWEHPSSVESPNSAPSPPPAAKERVVRHGGRGREMVAAAAVLCLLGGLSLTEATGVTHLVATVLRISTPDGTLVVETDDPAVKVTVEGDGDLVITGAGLEEFRLRPGNYRVLADRDGKPVPLDRNLVEVTRGDRAIVKVKLEAPPAAAAAKAETGAFVLLGRMGVAEPKFETLAEAVQAASDGDTIEVRGNGPFLTEPIHFGNQALTLRAAEGHRPVIQLKDDANRKLSFFASATSMTLEGLEFRSDATSPNGHRVAFDAGRSLHLANCRLLLPGFICVRREDYTRQCTLTNCEVLGCQLAALGTGEHLSIDNCVLLAGYALGFPMPRPDQEDSSFQLTQTTFVGLYAGQPFLNLHNVDKPRTSQTLNPVQIQVFRSILKSGFVLSANQPLPPLSEGEPLRREEFETLLQRVLGWRGQQNVYSLQAGFLMSGVGTVSNPPHGPKDLGAWSKFWDSPETGSIEGSVRFKGGNLVAKLEWEPEQLSPDDFRLRPDSPGYRAGPGGKDLGADVDLVGPGAAYERWKKTPEYQEWLKETNQSVVSRP